MVVLVRPDAGDSAIDAGATAGRGDFVVGSEDGDGERLGRLGRCVVAVEVGCTFAVWCGWRRGCAAGVENSGSGGWNECVGAGADVGELSACLIIAIPMPRMTAS